MIKLSTIIPIYNKEKALKQTLQSIVDNHEIDDNEYECILVDDESTDGCSDICKEFCKKYSYFKYIRIFNDGNKVPSNARNCGMKYCSGKYIHFLDADDELCKTFYKDAIKVLELTNVDFFVRGFYVKEENVLKWFVPTFKDRPFGPPLFSIVFRNYIKELKFEPVLSQDVIFSWLACYNRKYYEEKFNFNSYIWHKEHSQVNKRKPDEIFPCNVVKCLQKYEYYPFELKNGQIVFKIDENKIKQ